MNKLIDKFFDSIRPEVILHLSTMAVSSALPDSLAEVFDDNPDDFFAALGMPLQEYVDHDELWGFLLEAGKTGFLVRFATPVPHDFIEGGFSYSWGWYHTQLIYADTYEEACEKAVVWRDNYVEKMRARSVAN